MFQIYKKGQGKYTRLVTLAVAVFIAVLVAGALSSLLYGYAVTRPPMFRFGIPTVIAIAMAVVVLWLINRVKSADFLIATEGEMKKVSWSSKREIVGSTKVVIVTTFMLAAILFGVDLVFIFLFKWAKVSG